MCRHPTNRAKRAMPDETPMPRATPQHAMKPMRRKPQPAAARSAIAKSERTAPMRQRRAIIAPPIGTIANIYNPRAQTETLWSLVSACTLSHTHHTLHRFSRRERTVWTRRSGTDLFETREIRDAIGASPIHRAPSCRERRARPVGRLARAQLHGALRELQVGEERLELECGRGVRAGTGLA